MDYRGNNIKKVGKIFVASQEACAELSFRTDGSSFWTYQPSTKRCWPKTSKSGRISMDNVVSGNDECGKPSASGQVYKRIKIRIVLLFNFWIYNFNQNNDRRNSGGMLQQTEIKRRKRRWWRRCTQDVPKMSENWKSCSYNITSSL